VFPHSHQEIARTRHADLIREATRERLAASVREGAPERPTLVGGWTLRWLRTAKQRLAVRSA
jgi:hypothetical protein